MSAIENWEGESPRSKLAPKFTCAVGRPENQLVSGKYSNYWSIEYSPY